MSNGNIVLAVWRSFGISPHIRLDMMPVLQRQKMLRLLYVSLVCACRRLAARPLLLRTSLLLQRMSLH